MRISVFLFLLAFQPSHGHPGEDEVPSMQEYFKMIRANPEMTLRFNVNPKTDFLDLPDVSVRPDARDPAASFGLTDDAADRIRTYIAQVNNVRYLYEAYKNYFARADVGLHGFKQLFHDNEIKLAQVRENLMMHLTRRGGRQRLQPMGLKFTCTKIMNEIKNNPNAKFDFPNNYKDSIITGNNTLVNTAFCICHIMDDVGLASQTCPPNRALWRNGMFGLMDMFLAERWLGQKTQELSIWASNNDVTLFNDLYGAMTKRMSCLRKVTYGLTEMTNGLQDGADAVAELNYNMREQWKDKQLADHFNAKK